MAEAVGARSGSPDSVIALATLRMIHDLMANSVEKGANGFLPRYGYRLDGFAAALKEPTTSACVDDCLKEIAAESDILQHIESPYVRLAIAWGGALVTSIRSTAKPGGRKPHRINKYTYAPSVGPQPTRPEAPSQRSAGGGPPDRQVHRVQPPSCDDENKV